MDERFLIYNGFKDDFKLIFNDLINRFNFKVGNVSNNGISFFNKRCILTITNETGIQIRLKIPKYNISEMIPVLSMFKGDFVYEQYRSIILKEKGFDTLKELSSFLINHFSDEMQE